MQETKNVAIDYYIIQRRYKRISWHIDKAIPSSCLPDSLAQTHIHIHTHKFECDFIVGCC